MCGIFQCVWAIVSRFKGRFPALAPFPSFLANMRSQNGSEELCLNTGTVFKGDVIARTGPNVRGLELGKTVLLENRACVTLWWVGG